MSTATSHVFRLPDLGEGLTEAELVSWLVSVGDVIEVRVTPAPPVELPASPAVPKP